MEWLASLLAAAASFGWWKTWRKLGDTRERFERYAYRMRRECGGDEALLRPDEQP